MDWKQIVKHGLTAVVAIAITFGVIAKTDVCKDEVPATVVSTTGG